MSNPAFIVDGYLEKKFIEKICKGKVVRILNCNGKTVSVDAIAKRIATQCRLFGGKYFPIVAWVDRESREISANDFANVLLQSIRNEGVSDNVIVGVADIMIENWILADREIVQNESKNRTRLPDQIEGVNGKSIMKKIIPRYHETTTGVVLLTKCRASIMSMASPSFQAFCQQLSDLDCWWLQR